MNKHKKEFSVHLKYLYAKLFLFFIICQIKRDKTFHLRNSKKLLMVFGN
ncbi:ABC transporter, partial [Enterococcus faecium]